MSYHFTSLRTFTHKDLVFYLFCLYRITTSDLLYSLKWTKFSQQRYFQNQLCKSAYEFRNYKLRRSAIDSKYDNPIRLFKSITNNYSRSYKFHSVALWWTQFTLPKSSYWYTNNPTFRSFFTTGGSIYTNSTLINMRRYVHRIEESLTFVYNLFYIDARYWMFANELFLEELLIFNWEIQSLTYKLFRYIHMFVWLKDLSHGSAIRQVMDFLKKVDLDFTIITDLETHMKARNYLQRYSIFTIGLIPINYNPWWVSYPIPTYSNSPKIQLIFIHILFYVRSLIR